MSTPQVSSLSPDLRNLQWKSNNFGAKVLGKMGWKDGEAVGKQQRVTGASASSEGLRIQKREEGLGVGADKAATLTANDVHQDFLAVLANLASEGEGAKKKKSAKSKSSKVVSLPTNKTTCPKVRKAKFQEKTAEDLKCIFGTTPSFPVLATTSSSSEEPKEKVKRKSESKGERKKKRRKP